MNAIELLKQDHRTVKELFKTHDGASDTALTEKRNVGERIFKELEVHMQIEEEIFYPSARDGAKDKTDDLVAESYEEHRVAKNLISQLKSTAPEHEEWDAKMKVLEESIEHHVQEEEGELFPKVRASLGDTYLEELEARMAERKRELTTPTASLSGSLVTLVTRAYDTLTGNGKTKTRARRAAPAAAATSTKKKVAAKSTRTGTKTARTTTRKPTRAARVSAKAKKVVTRAKTRAASARTRAAKVVKTARKQVAKRRRSARR